MARCAGDLPAALSGPELPVVRTVVWTIALVGLAIGDQAAVARLDNRSKAAPANPICRVQLPSRRHPAKPPLFMSEIETAEAPATEKSVPHLYLVDGSSYIFRAYHRLPPLTNRHGQPAGAVYGYTTMLWKLADGLTKADGPTHMAVILDASRAYPPQRDVRPVQGAPAAAARGPGPAIPADPRRDPRLLDPVHRGSGAGGGRHHRLLRHRGEAGRLEGDDRQLRQGSDAADRRGCRHRHARHDERPPDRTRRRCSRSSACRRRRSATCSR